MKKLFLFFLLLFLQTSIQCMDLALIQQPEFDEKELAQNKRLIFEIKEIGFMQYLNMIARLNLAKTCKSWYSIIKPQEMWYQNAHPGWIDTENCKELNHTSYTHAMIYYARQNNTDMFNFIHDNASDENKQLSIKICNTLDKSFRQKCREELIRIYANKPWPGRDDDEEVLFNFIYNNANEKDRDNSINMSTKLKEKLMQTYTSNDYSSYFKRLTQHGSFTSRCPHIFHIFLLQGMNVNWQFKDGGTFLHFIAEGKEKHLFVGQIMDHPQINVNIKNQWGDDPLHRTIFEVNEHKKDKLRPCLAITQKLLERPDIDPNSQDKSRRTPLLLALERKRKDLVELLLKNKKVDLNITDKNENSPLHYSIIYEFIDLISDREIPINLDSHKKYGGPLHCAQTNKAINFLFSIPDIDVNSKNDLGETPLQHAIRKPTYTITSGGSCSIEEAARFDYDDTQIKCLLAHPQTNINARNSFGETSLHLAIKLDVPHEFHINILNLLLAKQGIDVNITDHCGDTPLDYALKRNCHYKEEVITLLNEHHAIRGSFLGKYKRAIIVGSLLSILGLISATIFAYFHYNTNILPR